MVRGLFYFVFLQLFFVSSVYCDSMIIVVDPVPNIAQIRQKADTIYLLSNEMAKKIEKKENYKIVYTRGLNDGSSVDDRLEAAYEAKGNLLISLKLDQSIGAEPNKFRVLLPKFIPAVENNETDKSNDFNLIVNSLKSVPEKKNSDSQKLANSLFRVFYKNGYSSPDKEPLFSSDDILIGTSMPSVQIVLGTSAIDEKVQREKIVGVITAALESYFGN